MEKTEDHRFIILNHKCRKCNTNNDVYAPIYVLDEDASKLLEYTPLDHAAEVLAKALCEGDLEPFAPEAIFRIWEELTPEERQPYINEAKELLKK